MKFGLSLPYGAGVAGDPEWMRSFVADAEASGFESVYLVEHIVMVDGHRDVYPYAESGRVPLRNDCAIPDPIDVLCYLAAVTDRIRLGTSVLVAPHHHPLMLAKRLATLDLYSSGRAMVGLGVGWMREEIEACGGRFDCRGRQTDELIDAMRAAWNESPANFHGEYFSFEGAMSYPKPLQPGGVPIHIGGHSMAAARRAGLRGDGFQPLGVTGDDLARRMVEMRRSAESVGRDPDAIELTLRGSLASIDEAAVEAIRAAGAHRVILSCTTAELERLAEQMWAVSALMDVIG
ncbi:MAG: LLM class F420-dependent oxidoreductase [Microthrixaceae bacterium]|nr:LLM class F420-dependent oxidoreductase [Microthrixaceae bacterium]MCO5312394.1 LLM class F420-dependent oxidoreductase [Microthrixaceae bacterium]HPB44676.1 LLM class F420-dependent oxidoreductase [Microthrixaceae bacterium]